jgi:hypothetical protein
MVEVVHASPRLATGPGSANETKGVFAGATKGGARAQPKRAKKTQMNEDVSANVPIADKFSTKGQDQSIAASEISLRGELVFIFLSPFS